MRISPAWAQKNADTQFVVQYPREERWVSKSSSSGWCYAWSWSYKSQISNRNSLYYYGNDGISEVQDPPVVALTHHPLNCIEKHPPRHPWLLQLRPFPWSPAISRNVGVTFVWWVSIGPASCAQRVEVVPKAPGLVEGKTWKNGSHKDLWWPTALGSGVVSTHSQFPKMIKPNDKRCQICFSCTVIATSSPTMSPKFRTARLATVPWMNSWHWEKLSKCWLFNSAGPRSGELTYA